MKDSIELMKLCQNGWLPDNTDDYIPDIVHDFIWDNWDELKDILSDD